MEKMAKEPTKALKAVWLPRKMHPKIVQIIPQSAIALKGTRSLSFTFAKKAEKGVALSRASAQNMRLHTSRTPISAMIVAKKATMRRPTQPI